MLNYETRLTIILYVFPLPYTPRQHTAVYVCSIELRENMTESTLIDLIKASPLGTINNTNSCLLRWVFTAERPCWLL